MIHVELEFLFYSSPPLFENWLERFRLKRLPLDFPISPDLTLSVPLQLIFHRESLGLRTHTLQAGLLRSLPDRPDEVECLLSFPALELHLYEPSVGRLRLHMICLHEKLVQYCLDLLFEMEKAWPEMIGQFNMQRYRLINVAEKMDGNPEWKFLAGLELPVHGKILLKSEWYAGLPDLAPAPSTSPLAVPPSPAAPSPAERWDRLSGDTQAKFRKAWKIYQQMLREYRAEVLDGASQRAQPTLQDFRDRILSQTNWRVGDRRLRDVIELGEAGVIK